MGDALRRTGLSLCTKRQYLRLFKLENTCRQQIKCDSGVAVCNWKDRNSVGKRENADNLQSMYSVVDELNVNPLPNDKILDSI